MSFRTSSSASPPFISVKDRPGTPYTHYHETPSLSVPPNVSSPLLSNRTKLRTKSKIPVRTPSTSSPLRSASLSVPSFPEFLSPICMSTIRETPAGFGYTLFLEEEAANLQRQLENMSIGDASKITPVTSREMAQRTSFLVKNPDFQSQNGFTSTPESPQVATRTRGALFGSSSEASNYVTCVSDPDLTLQLSRTLVNVSVPTLGSEDEIDATSTTP